MVTAGQVSGKLVIAGEADWQLLQPGDVVVDPLVLRYGEIFLGGWRSAGGFDAPDFYLGTSSRDGT
jgi:hypothetical protein